MAGEVTTRGTNFAPKVVKELINKVKGKSSLAALCAGTPIPFNGMKEFIFSLDSEIDIVAEGGAKSHGGLSLEPVTIVPIKVEYGARVTDEFLYATEEEQIEILEAFNEGFAKKLAKGLDIAAMHGVNPRTGQKSTVVGANNFDDKVTQTVEYDAATIDSIIGTAIDMVNDEGEVTGMALSNTCRQDLSKLETVGGGKKFPELEWGGSPGSVKGQRTEFNSTVSLYGGDQAIIGDYQNMFKWGYAKEIPMEIIKYGDPDNSGNDLKGHNQVYIRAEAYIGWGILDPNSFTRIIDPTMGS